PKPATPAFFISTRGGRLAKSAFNPTFAKLIQQVGLEGRGQRARPRPHDLRHTFAVQTLLDWHHAGAEVDRQLPLLATYLGHAHPESSYWYLQSSPELLELIGQRLHGVLGDQS
ncbi:MAG: tyrosine-type recombinase/integrase, partial [Actinobacteria bacterium]|nr:tyrosine-type recombinase/integrase [Actinomycetota bacterium]